MYKVGLYTLGCKVSLYETEAVAESFEREGFLRAPFDSVCDVYVINTCTVTAESDAKSRKYIRRALRKNPNAAVIVIGCYSQRAPQEIADIGGVCAVIGTQDKLSAVKLAQQFLADPGKAPVISVSPLEGACFEKMRVESAPRTRAYVKIEDGCECKCSYCAIAPARGPVRSKPLMDVVEEVEGLSRAGVYEIVLTGIETGSYGKDLQNGENLGELIALLNERGSCGRIRLGSMAPELLTPKFITRVAALPIMVPHFHISMQSGSNPILARMRRRYTREMAMRSISLIRSLMPDVMLTADLMVGFPGETEQDFLDTVSFVHEAGLLDAHVFAYSEREGTPAAGFDGRIPEEQRRKRSAVLIAEKNVSRDRQLAHTVEQGRALPAILESSSKGVYTAHSDSYIELRCSADGCRIGELVEVIPEYAKDGIIYGKARKCK